MATHRETVTSRRARSARPVGREPVALEGVPVVDQPFAEVLDEALTCRGLTLDRVAEKLASRGAPVSVSTLSLWRRGRTRPTRQRSQIVLSELERVLGLGSGTLAEALDIPQAWQPEWWRLETPVDQLATAYGAFLAYTQAAGITTSSVERWYVCAVLEVDASRRRTRMRATQVLHASDQPATSTPVMYWTDERTEDDQPTLLEVTEVIGARLEKAVEFPEVGAIGGLLVYDEPLQPGESTVIEVVMDWVTQAPLLEGWYSEELQMPVPVGGLTLEVRFDGEPPRRARSRVTQRLGAGTMLAEVPAEELPTGPVIQGNVVDVASGGIRLEWTWGDGA